MSLKLITAASGLAVTLAEAKLHLRVTSSAEDLSITSAIMEATDLAEQMTGRAIMSQTWELSLDAFPAFFKLTRVPVQSITSLTYIDILGAQQTLSAGGYTLDNADDFGLAFVIPSYGLQWPAARLQPNAVKVRYQAGYVDAASVPYSIKAWIKLMVGALHENREAETVGLGGAISLGFSDRLLDRYKVWEL